VNMLLDRLNDALAQVLADAGQDHRTVYIRARVLPPDASTVELETSDAALAERVLARLDLAGAERASLRLALLPAPGAPERLVVISSVADVRRAPSHQAELVSQGVYGDVLQPLKADGDWILVRMDDAYLGWVRSWHVAPTTVSSRGAFEARARHRLADPVAQVLAEPVADGLPVSDAVVGTPLVVTPGGRRGWVAVELPDGRGGFLRSRQVEKRPARARPRPADLVRTGLRFLGTPYLWGGNTPKGFDCSGLVQRIYRLHGVVLPRDADMQAHFGKDKSGIPPSAWRPGDLLFFGAGAGRITHVAMVLPGGAFLHAFGQVIVNSLDTNHAGYREDLARIWRGCRDPLDIG